VGSLLTDNLSQSQYFSLGISLCVVCVLGEEKKMEERGERERSFVKKIGEEEEK
jgi:hypothetical protein